MTQLHHPQVLLRNPMSANRTPILLQHCSQQLGQGTSLFVHKQRSSVWEDVGSLQPQGVGGWRGGLLWEHEDLSWNLQHSGTQTWVQQPHTRTRRSSDITVSFSSVTARPKAKGWGAIQNTQHLTLSSTRMWCANTLGHTTHTKTTHTKIKFKKQSSHFL